ncbi:RAD51-associated protein 1-like isoform X2 [Haliotis rufescens]|uniref:RAD51-associated protein 1-like isoform X2 n=1 Tax=Haliotis rufescens TaxID=6454 RepID=UPI00201F226A|nr:RAD51-associated protein 1-like isoform X2 [Haliotis rufescens]
MSTRRSKRERKKINYAAFGDGDDDDFADPTPPGKKKSTLANKENKEKSRKSEKAVRPDKNTQRLSLEEKLFKRDLQAALNLSANESQASSDGSEVVNPDDKSHQVTVTVESAPPPSCIKTSVTESDGNTELVEQPDPDFKPGSDHQLQHVSAARKWPAEEEEVIQVLESDILSGEQPSKRRRVTASPPKKSKYVDSDSEGSEFEADSDSDSDQSFDEGDDSDFDDGSKSKSKASKVLSTTMKPAAVTKTKPAPAAATKTNPNPAAATKTKPAPATKGTGTAQRPATKPQLQSTTGKTTSVVRKTVSLPSVASVSPQSRMKGIPGHKTSWTPPASSSSCKSAVGSRTMTSPSAGIRLGLSRNQRVKSLHPSLQVQQ